MLGTISVILGFIGFFADINWLLFLAGGVYIIDIFIQVFLGEQKSLLTSIVAALIAVVVSRRNDYPVIQGVCFGLCVEGAIMTILGIISLIARKISGD